MKNLRNSKIFNTLWYMFGSLSYGFTSLIYMIIINRVLGIDAVGQYSFAFAIAAIFYTIGVYFGMTYQVTDISNKYSNMDYIYNRLTTCLMMIIIASIFSYVSGYDCTKFLLVMLLVFYRGFDALLDSIHAIIQRNDKIYKIGILVFLRTVLLIVTFLIVTLLFKNLVSSVVSIVIVDLVFTLLVEYNVVKKYIDSLKFSIKKNHDLIINGFSVFIFSFLAMYIINSPKYAIDMHLNDKLQGVFGIIFMPSSFMSMISIYFVHPFLNEITSYIKNYDYKSLTQLIIKISKIIFVFGLLISAVAYLIGIPVLELMYDENLSQYRIDLFIIMLGTILYSIYALFSSVLIAMRKNVQQVIILIIVSLVALISCNVLILNTGLIGASYAYFITMLFQLLAYIIVYMRYASKKWWIR